MRHVVVGLLAAAGCNQIWGLGPVDLDQGSGSGSDPQRFRITAQIAQTTDQGAADPMLVYVPITPPPMVQIGPLGGPLEARPYADDGSVVYCDKSACVAPARTPWRLVYTLADGLPREVQWAPEADLAGHLTEPQIGRLERPVVPAGGGYTITPMSSPRAHSLTRVFTTGLWTEGGFTATIGTAKVDYDFSMKAKSLSGPLGAPQRARSDYGILADFKTNTPAGCRLTSGVAAFLVPDLVDGMLSAPAPQPEYIGPDKQVRLSLGGPKPVDFRLNGLLGGRAGTSDRLHMEYGYTPSLGMFGFSRPAPTPRLDFYLPGPQLIALASCEFVRVPLYMTDLFADPQDIRDRFPPVVHVEATNQRTRGALTLTSGFSAVVTSTDYNFSSGFAVAAPVRIKLVHDGTPIADLEDVAAEGTPLPALAPMDLVFDLEAEPTLTADSFEITLYEVKGGSQLERLRVFTVADRKLALDPAIFRPGAEYVFEVRAFTGRPKAAMGDFASHMYPQYAVTVFTRIFKTP
jgi:hypothetical protein